MVVVVLAVISVFFCFADLPAIRASIRSRVGGCLNECLSIYSDEQLEEQRRENKHRASASVDKGAVAGRGSVWGSLCAPPSSAVASGTSTEFISMMESGAQKEVARLKEELAQEVERCKQLQIEQCQAENKRQTLLAEAAHVSDETASFIEGVLLESEHWAEAAKSRAPELATHIDFMTSTMHACGQEALAPNATSQQRCRASEMASLCSAAMVNFSEGRARNALRKAEELEKAVRDAEIEHARIENKISEHGTMAEQIVMTEAEAEVQQQALDEAEQSIERMLATGKLTRSPLGRYARRMVPSEASGAAGGAESSPAERRVRSGSGVHSRGNSSTYRSVPIKSPAGSPAAKSPTKGIARGEDGDGAESSGCAREALAACEAQFAYAQPRKISDEEWDEYTPYTPRGLRRNHRRDSRQSPARLTASPPHRQRLAKGGLGSSHAGVHPFTKTFSPHAMALGASPDDSARAQNTLTSRGKSHRRSTLSRPQTTPHAHGLKSSAPRPGRRIESLHGDGWLQGEAHTGGGRRPRASASLIVSSSALELSDMETVFDGRLGTCCYTYNDLLLRINDADGFALPAAERHSPGWNNSPIGGRRNAAANAAGHEDEAGAGASSSSWLSVLASSRPLFLQLDGVPSALATLVTPGMRLHVYGAAGAAFAACHLGGPQPVEAMSERLDVSTHAVYCDAEITAEQSEEAAGAAPGQEVVRHVRILAPRTARARAAARGEVTQGKEVCGSPEGGDLFV